MEKKIVLLISAMAVFMLLSIPSYSQTGYSWDFNEGSGNSVKDSTGKYAVTWTVDVMDESISPSGKAGDRSVFPYGGLKVDDSNTPAFASLISGPLTVEAWVYPRALTGWTDLMRIGNSIKAGFSEDKLVFTLLGVVDITADGVAVPVDDQWHQIAYVWTPGTGVDFYLDGELAQTVEDTNAPRAFDRDAMSIGADYAGASNFSGLIDRFRVHNAVLSKSQLDLDAKNPKAILDKTVVAYNFDETAAPFASSTKLIRPALKSPMIAFSPDNPKGAQNDYSLSFTGSGIASYDDNENLFFDFVNEPFTFQTWMKFRPEEQIAERPIFFAYGVGGQGGYSFSFRPATPPSSAAGASGKAGDSAVNPGGGLLGDDTDPSALNVIDGPLTAEAWVNPKALTGDTDIFRIGNSIKLGFSSAQLVWTFLGVEDVFSGVNINTGSWQHIAAVWEPGVKVTFYVDGKEAAAIDTGNYPREFASPNRLSIGAAEDATSKFNGAIDRFRVHKALLTAAQLDSTAATVKATLSSTIAAFNFDEAEAPYQNSVNAKLPVNNQFNKLTVTTYGIVDAHSNAKLSSDGKWHHVAAVLDLDKGEFRFYVDAKLADTYPYTNGVNPAPSGSAIFYLGCESGGGLPYVGLLDRIRIVRGILTPDKFDYFAPVSALSEWSLY